MGDLTILSPARNSELSGLDHLHENSEQHYSDADFQRQLAQVLPAVGGRRVHDSEVNPTKEWQETASVQKLLLSGNPAGQSGRLKTPGLPDHAERALPAHLGHLTLSSPFSPSPHSFPPHRCPLSSSAPTVI